MTTLFFPFLFFIFFFLFINPVYPCEEVALVGERLGVWALEQGGRTTANALALLGIVALFADPAGVCILTPTDLQARAGLNKSSFTQALAELIDAGLLAVQESTTGTAFSVLAPREYLDDATAPVSAAGELERGLRIISTTLSTTAASDAGMAG
ncbi:MarR family transcriptional regulator, partial [Actinotignum schaalii]